MAGAAGALGRVPRASLSAPRAEGDGIGRPPGTATAFGEATAVVPRDAALAGIELLGPAILGGVASGVTGPVVAAVPVAAGMDDDGRGTDDATARGAGVGGAEGDRMAMTAVRPTNPIATAATP